MSEPYRIEQEVPIYVGDTWTMEVIFWLDDAQTAPDDVSGSTFDCQIRRTDKSEDVAATVTCGTTNNQTLGLSLTADQTRQIKPGTYVMDLQEIKADTTVETPLRWENVVVSRDVTRVTP